MANLESLWEEASPISSDENLDELWAAAGIPPPAEPQERSLADTFAEYGGGIVKGALGGASRIGDVLIGGATFLPRQLSPELEQWNRERQASLEDYRRSYADDIVAQGADIAAQIAGTAGIGGVLGTGATAANLPRLAKALETGGFSALGKGGVVPNALIRLMGGAGTGAGAAAMTSPEDITTGAGIGAATTALGNPLLKGAALGAGKAVDFITGQLPAVRAGQIARDVAGPHLAAIRAANLGVSPTLTSAQAAVDVPRYEWAALGERAKQADPTAFGLKAEAQETARLRALEKVTPDIDKAVSQRAEITVPIYREALESTKRVNTRPVAQMVDKLIEDNPKLSSIVGPMSEIKAGLAGDTNVKSLASLSQNIKEKIAAKNPDGTPQFDVKALTKVKEKLDAQIGTAEPLYEKARKTYAKLSAPINQAKLLQAMKDTLVSSKGGERVTPFLNALGTGEKALFRRADQSPRFGSIDEVLTPQQKKVKDSIVSQLRRDAEVARKAAASSKKTSEIMSQDSLKARLPSFIDKWFAAANKGIDIAETGVNKKTMEVISKGMRTGKSANQMLDTLPAEERNKILRGLVMMQQGGIVPASISTLSTGE